MHMFHILGHAPESLTAVIGAIRELPEHCRLVHAPDPVYMADMETNDYTGPLLHAPMGVYHLWQGHTGEPLVVTENKFLIGKKVLYFRASRSSPVVVPDDVLDAFTSLLKTSEKRLYVYQNVDRDQKFDLLWPEEVIPQQHRLNPAYEVAGRVDLVQRRVIPLTEP